MDVLFTAGYTSFYSTDEGDIAEICQPRDIVNIVLRHPTCAMNVVYRKIEFGKRSVQRRGKGKTFDMVVCL